MSIRSRILCDNNTLLDTRDYDPLMTEAKFSGSFSDRIIDCKLEITLLPSHPMYGAIRERLSTVTSEELFPPEYDPNTGQYVTTAKELFHGRPIAVDYDIYHKMKVVCECDAKFLEDVPDIFSMVGLSDDDDKTTLGAAIGKIFKKFTAEGAGTYGYNGYAAADRKIYLDASFDSNSDFAKKEIDKPSNSSIYSNLRTWMETVEGYAKVIPVNGHYELKLGTDRGAINNAFSVEYGENVTDYKLQRSSENFYTAIHAVGKNNNSSISPSAPTGSDADNYILGSTQLTLSNGTVAPVPAGVLCHKTYAEVYGVIIYHEEFSPGKNETLDGAKVTKKAIESLEKKMKRYETLDISMIDPRLIGIEKAVPMLGDSYRISIPLSDYILVPLEQYQPLTKYDKDYLDDTKSKLTFGDKRNALSDRSKSAIAIAKSAQSTANAAARTASTVKNNQTPLITVVTVNGNTMTCDITVEDFVKAVNAGKSIFCRDGNDTHSVTAGYSLESGTYTCEIIVRSNSAHFIATGLSATDPLVLQLVT